MKMKEGVVMGVAIGLVWLAVGWAGYTVINAVASQRYCDSLGCGPIALSVYLMALLFLTGVGSLAAAGIADRLLKKATVAPLPSIVAAQ